MEALKTTEQHIIALIKQHIAGTAFENKSFVAGGYVRDLLMNVQSKDIDIVVALPEGGIKLATYLSDVLHLVSKPVIFPKYGTAKITIEGLDVEFVMTRKEQYHFQDRKPDVEIGTIEDDVKRRDFTVNSLLLNISTGEILDLTGFGKEDIKNGIVRTPLDPDIIFKEDPLRMMRAIRFVCQKGWELGDNMLFALKKNSAQVQWMSMERIREEFSKIMVSKDPVRGIKMLMETRLSVHFLPELLPMIKCEQNDHHKWDVFDHTMNVVRNTPARLEVRLAALFHDIAKPKVKVVIEGKIKFHTHEDMGAHMANDIMSRLKFPGDVIDRVVLLVKNHMRLKPAEDNGMGISDKAIRKLKFECSDVIDDLLDLMHADNISHADASNMPNQIGNIRRRISEIKDIPAAQHMQLPITGEDVMLETGLKAGAEVGRLLGLIKEAFLDNPEITKEECLLIIKN
jgi:poly(A) polymerase